MRGTHYISQECKRKAISDCDGYVSRKEFNDHDHERDCLTISRHRLICAIGDQKRLMNRRNEFTSYFQNALRKSIPIDIW